MKTRQNMDIYLLKITILHCCTTLSGLIHIIHCFRVMGLYKVILRDLKGNISYYLICNMLALCDVHQEILHYCIKTNDKNFTDVIVIIYTM